MLFSFPSPNPLSRYPEARPYFGVSRRDVLVRATVFIIRVGAVGTDAIDVTRYDEGEDLLACPQRPGLEDSWLWDFPIPRGEEH